MDEARANRGGGPDDGAVLAAEAPAKVNLRLKVFGRDGSGYHGLETIFLRLELADRVRVELRGEGLELTVDCRPGVPAESIPSGEDNLCLEAARAFGDELEDRGRPLGHGLRIHLEKRIPAGSGLGGGSADAGAVLRVMNHLAGGPLGTPELVALGARLGSDVPFAVLPGAAALGWGRGHRLLPLEPPPPRPALVALPGIGVSTPEAFSWLDTDRVEGGEGAAGSGGRGLALPPAGDLRSWGTLTGLARNDFEGPVFRRHPELATLKELLSGDAILSLLSGSGDAVFGIYPSESARDRAAQRVVEETGAGVVQTNTARMAAPRTPAVEEDG